MTIGAHFTREALVVANTASSLINDEFRSSEALGILYAEDFEADAEQPPLEPELEPEPDLEPEPKPLTPEDVDAACVRAVEAAQAAWAESAAERRAAALEAIAAQLGEGRLEAHNLAEAAADGIARTALAMMASLLPHLCRLHGDAEVKAMVRLLLPSLVRSGPVVIRVHAGLVESLRADIEAADDALLDQVELRAGNLPAGDVKLSWPEGGLVRDTASIRAAIGESLVQLGLLDPPSPSRPPQPALKQARSLEHAG